MTRKFISTACFILAFFALHPAAWPEETVITIEPAAEALENFSITTSPAPLAPPASPSAEERFNGALALFKLGDYDGAVSAALETAGLYPGTNWDSRAVFLAGRAYAAKRDVDSATMVLGFARQKYPILADYSVFLKAGLYYKLARYEEAAEAYSSLAAEYPASILVPDSLLKAGDCYLKLGRLPDAIIYLERFVYLKGSSAQAAAARYMLMSAYAGQGDSEAAYAQYRALWLGHPGNVNTAKAEDLMQGLIQAGSVMPEPSSGDYIKRADRLSSNGRYRLACTEYRKALGLLAEDESPAGEVLLKLGLCNYRSRENESAEYYFRKVADNPLFSGNAPEALFWLARTCLRAGDDACLHEAAIRVATEYPDAPRAVDSLYLLGASYASEGDYDSAIGVFSTILDSTPESVRADEALWQVGWASFNKGDYDAAEKTFKRIPDGHPGSGLVPQALYWRGRALAALDRQPEAGLCYDEAARGYGLSYYGSLADEALNPDDSETAGTPAPPPIPRLMEGYSDTALVRAVELGIQGMLPEGVRELRAVERRYGGTLEDAKAISEVYNYLGEYQRPLELATNLYGSSIKTGKGEVPDDALSMLFPLAYWDLVSGQAGTFGVDPLLVFSVIREESRFNPGIVSPAGAVGLMQLMPGTAMAVCRRMGIEYASSEQLKDEGFNLPVGTCYLKSLLEKHAGRLVYALAEYNAGPGPLARWIERDPCAPDDVFIENIGYYETRGYVKRVLRNYYLYKRLYGAGEK